MKTTNRSSKNNTHPFRLLAGFYLCYLAYSLVKDWQRLDNKIFFVIFIIIFAAVGAFLIINSGLSMLRNNQTSDSGDAKEDAAPESEEAMNQETEEK